MKHVGVIFLQITIYILLWDSPKVVWVALSSAMAYSFGVEAIISAIKEKK